MIVICIYIAWHWHYLGWAAAAHTDLHKEPLNPEDMVWRQEAVLLLIFDGLKWLEVVILT